MPSAGTDKGQSQIEALLNIMISIGYSDFRGELHAYMHRYKRSQAIFRNRYRHLYLKADGEYSQY